MSADRYAKTLPISWEQLHKDARSLARRVAEHGPFQGIVAVARGGLVPASVLARELNIRLVTTLCLSSYDWKQQGADVQCLLNTMQGDGEGWLIVDDLVDTGRTAGAVRRLLPKGLFVALYAKPAGKPHVDMFVSEVDQDTWILQPWDSSLDFTPPIAG